MLSFSVLKVSCGISFRMGTCVAMWLLMYFKFSFGLSVSCDE